MCLILKDSGKIRRIKTWEQNDVQKYKTSMLRCVIKLTLYY